MAADAIKIYYSCQQLFSSNISGLANMSDLMEQWHM
jgi:hypothetical protein